MSVEMEEFLLELRVLDETQERVEAVSDEMLKAQEDGDPARAKEMVDVWMQELRSSDFQSERIAYLYVANHVLQKTLFGEPPCEKPLYVELLRAHLEEAVAFVSNSPADRQSVARLLELWHEKEIYSDQEIFEMWKCTGEDIPDFLQAASAAAGVDDSENELQQQQHLDDPDAEMQQAPMPELPSRLNSHSANPVLDMLKRIDHHKTSIRYLDDCIKKTHQFVLLHAPSRYTTPESLMEDTTTSCFQMKQRVEDCLRLVKVRNKLLHEIPALERDLKEAVRRMIDQETAAGSKIEQKLEQCDMIDIGLADLAEHREAYPDEWLKEADACAERRKRKDEEQRHRDEEIARLHQEAIAESAAHAMQMEANIRDSDLQALSKEMGAKREEPEQKPDTSNEVVWHPVLKELVPLQSLNLEWEDWRDH
ncbi:TPA: hypothetical protein N0F65_009038 [Lagenidium giganteum]|uniref:CID domain-containing protein n=1 Tax=Lagenidium giganteum TaxID=4803 RepID=A0AAV2YV88_9STRA|nr:TPA: hypothetical protein N0F65_009038 [Lagenidium giganteum]